MSKEAFFDTYRPYAAQAAAELKVPESAILAHWATETGWGKSIIPETNNLGNIKDVSKAGTGVAAVDNETKTTDRYRKYASLEEGTQDYVALIKRRHAGAMNQTTARGFAEALKASGYFESANGVNNITRIAGEPLGPYVAPTPDPRIAALNAAIQKTIERPIRPTAKQSSLDLATVQARADRNLEVEAAPTPGESVAAAVAGNTDMQFIDALKEHIWGPKHPPEAGYTTNFDLLKKATNDNADSELVADYAQAKSSAEANDVITKWQDERARIQTVMAHGKATGMALSFAAEIPAMANLIPAVGAAKLMKLVGQGSEALAASGASYARVAGAAVTENILGGTAVEAMRQKATGHFSLGDLAISVAADGVFGLGSAGLAVRGFDIDKAAASSVARDAHYAARAQDAAGVNASVSEIKAAMERIEAADLRTATTVTPEVTSALSPFDAPSRFANPSNEKAVAREMTNDSRFTEMADLGIFKHTEDFAERKAQLDALNAAPGVHLAEGVQDNGMFKRYAKAVEVMRKQLIPEVSIHLTDGSVGIGTNTGLQGIIKPGVSMIAVKPGAGMRAVTHEFAHAVFAHRLSQASPEAQAAMADAWRAWQKLVDMPGKAQEAMLQRSPVSAAGDAAGDAVYRDAIEGNWKGSLREVFSQAFTDTAERDKFVSYLSNFDEFSAEQLVKYVEAQYAGEIAKTMTLPVQLIRLFTTLLDTALAVFKTAKEKQLVAPNAAFSKFFDDLIVGNKKANLPAFDMPPASATSAMAVPAKPGEVVNELLTDPDALKYGLTTLPMGTADERKQAQAILAMHKQAGEWAVRHPMDAEYLARVQNLADNNVFNVASNGLTMLKSENPLVRMIASELLEDASGVQGKRKPTAAISKWLVERQMLGNAINDVQGAYEFWKKGQNGSLWDDMVGGQRWDEWNKLLAGEMEARLRAGGPVSTDPNVKAAVDSLEAAYQRSANAQRTVNTLGSEGLPLTSVGYMPHRMNPKAVINLTNEQTRILHSALSEQFIGFGWDLSFSDQLASAYIKRVRDRATGDYGSHIGGGNAATSSLVEEALRSMDLPDDVIKQHMGKFKKGAANFTKKRLDLDLNQVHQTATGEFKLLDVFETNQLELLRQQVGRASGEVALTKFGVRGKPGLQLLRDAMQYGEDGKRTAIREAEAFDQMAAEFLNEPFGTQAGKFMERAMAANTLVRLGGIAFNQLAESINGIFHIGAARTMSTITGIPRLRSEIKELAAGQHVDNPIIGSIELAGGAEFGTDAYKVVMPFDSPDHAYPTYGQDTLTLTDRLLRGGGYLQAKLSGWRLLHSAQQRGMAEQIVHKMMRYVREGKDDIALDQFGIHADLRHTLRGELNQIATFDSKGNLTHFDVTKLSDTAVREEVIQAVWRGTAQIIQGTFIGERGKWAHDGWLKMLTQFRTFSITSMEKQWGRQRNSRGNAAAFGMMMGAMSIAAPIYMARVYANAVGRPDADKYIDERMEFQNIARATLNYLAMSGMAGDFLDLTTSLLPDSAGVKPTGGRAGVESAFVGNYVAPSLSLVDDIWKYAQSPDKVDELAKLFPGSRIPYLLPLVNSLKD